MVMVAPRNRGQRVALGMGWTGEGQGQGGHRSWVDALDPTRRAEYDTRLGLLPGNAPVTSGNYGTATDGRIQLGTPLSGAKSSERVGQYTKAAPTYSSILAGTDAMPIGSTDWANAHERALAAAYGSRTDDQIAQWRQDEQMIKDLFGTESGKQAYSTGGKFYSVDMTRPDGVNPAWSAYFNQGELDAYNQAQGTAYTREDIDNLRLRGQELQYLLDGPNPESFVSQYGLPLALGAVAAATGGMAGLYGAPAAATGETVIGGTGIPAGGFAGATGVPFAGEAATGLGTVIGGSGIPAGGFAGATGVPFAGEAATGIGTAIGGSGIPAGGFAGATGVPFAGEAAGTGGGVLSSLLSSGTPSVSSPILDAVGGAGDIVGDVVGGVTDYFTQDDIQNTLLEGQAQAKELLQPYADRGTSYSDRLDALIGSMPNYSTTIDEEIAGGSLGGRFTMDDFEADPGYQFRKEEGEKALRRSLAAIGMDQSGAAVKDAIRFNQGMAADEYDRAYKRSREEEATRYGMLSDRERNLMGLLTGQQDIGVDATGNLAGLLLGDSNIKALSKREKSEVINNLVSLLT